ncbi:hypothetical protein ACFU46_02850 [Streptomyces griseoincarnatus]
MNEKTLSRKLLGSTQKGRDPLARDIRDQLLSLLMLLTGVWLFVCIWLLSYPNTYRVPHLVETGGSIVVILTALARLTRPRGRVSDLVIGATGAGLILAAFLADYGENNTADVIRVNQAATGSVLILLAAASAFLAMRSRSSPAPRADDD